MALIAKVAVDKAAYHFDLPFDYLVPSTMEKTLSPGCRVKVPFGRSNHSRMGIVLEITQEQTEKQCKEIITQVDNPPLLNEEFLNLLHYLKKSTFCTYFDALGALLPYGIGVNIVYQYRTNPRFEIENAAFDELQQQIFTYLRARKKPVEETVLLSQLGLVRGCGALSGLCAQGAVLKEEQIKRRVQDEKMLMVRLCDDYDGNQAGKTPKQSAVVQLLEEVGSASLKEVCYFAAVTRNVVDRLHSQNVVEYYEDEVLRSPYETDEIRFDRSEILLSQPQQNAYETLRGLYQTGTSQTALLYGVTGSGKTVVFLKLIEDVIASGRKVLVMVPEISLTPQTIERFRSRFGTRVALMHSGLSLGQRLDEWKKVKQNLADIVVGTRSAVFAPLENIGLIVMDEEQEHTYKSERSPRFHAREVAAVRCRYHSALLLLASATPSVESFYHAKRGTYHLVRLEERFGSAKLPDVSIVDMRQQQLEGNADAISDQLATELYYNLQHREQSILLLNRRGYHTIVKCSNCGEAVYCPHCSISLTYHSANKKLVCHYCGYMRDIQTTCEHCGSSLIRYSGAGTQLVHEQLAARFPDARILRMDMDTTMSRFSYERGFHAFGRGEYDIMIGTQMVAKGLDFPNVTLVGVLCADQSLYSDDFRSLERTFSLVTQVVGRCGRGERSGRAFIQTFTPESHILELASTQQYERFFEEEIAYRKLQLYPPMCDVIGVGFVSQNELALRKSARWFLNWLTAEINANHPDLPVRILGPVPSPVYKAAGRYRYRMMIKCRKSKTLYELLSHALTEFLQYKENKEVSVYLDPTYDYAT